MLYSPLFLRVVVWSTRCTILTSIPTCGGMEYSVCYTHLFLRVVVWSALCAILTSIPTCGGME